MSNNRHSLIYNWSVIVSLVWVLVLFPAAELVSAAGMAIPQSVWAEETVSRKGFGQVACDEGCFVYLPLVLRRWPPLPYAPVLSPIASPVLDAPYVLSWSADLSREVEPFLFYTIEEAATPNFANSTVYIAPFTYTSTLVFSSYVITKPIGTVGTYYYRVRAHNTWGAGAWSNVQAANISTYIDRFDHPQTGWQARRTSSPDIGLMQAYYVDGNLETFVRDLFDFAIFSPMYTAPSTPYSLQVRTRVIHKVNEVSYGLAFGGNRGTLCEVQRDVATNPEGCFSHYYRINVIWAGNYLKYNVSRIDGHDDRGRGISTELRGFYDLSGVIADPADWQLWEVRVYDDGFAIYLNDRYMAWIADTTYLHDPLYGIFSSTYEYNNAHFQHYMFYVVSIDQASHPMTAGAMSPLSANQSAEPR